jgi:hypothetical protein
MTEHTNRAQYDQIPEELRNLPNWLVWKLEKRAGKNGIERKTKVPYSARTGKYAKSNDPSTWSSFAEAEAAANAVGGYDGIGFCLSGLFVGIDLDGCREPETGVIEPWATELMHTLDTYFEVSPSQTGLRGIAKGSLPAGRRQRDFGDRDHHGVALYEAGGPRYLTMTGWRVGGNGTIAERTQELHVVHARLFPPKARAKARAAGSDDDLIARARRAKDGGKFSRLWDGRWEGEYESQSEADLALCVKLAFWTGRDAGRIDSLFRRSGLMREKWDRQDYRERTITKAIEQTGETWKPREETIVLAAAAVGAGIETLNQMALFHGRIRFQSVSRRGSMILAATAEGQQIIFPTMTDLTSFARARAAIADGADVLLPQPPKAQVHEIWDAAASMIIKLAAQDAIRVEHILKAECKDLLMLMWRFAKQPSAKNSRQFMIILTKIAQAVRGVRTKDELFEEPAPPCVFIAEEHVWVHVPCFRNWISLPVLTNRLYPLADIRQGLLLLGFEYLKDLTRGADGKEEKASLWCGPLEVLE